MKIASNSSPNWNILKKGTKKERIRSFFRSSIFGTSFLSRSFWETWFSFLPRSSQKRKRRNEFRLCLACLVKIRSRPNPSKVWYYSKYRTNSNLIHFSVFGRNFEKLTFLIFCHFYRNLVEKLFNNLDLSIFNEIT